MTYNFSADILSGVGEYMYTNLSESPGTNLSAGNRQRINSALVTRLRNNFIQNPSWYYSMSIAASWAGVGSLMVGIQMAQNFGIAPFLLWAFGNTMACIVFGIFAPMIPKVREVFRSRIMHYIVGLMCVFQVSGLLMPCTNPIFNPLAKAI